MAEAEQIWIARLTPMVGGDVASLLDVPLGLDVWERHAGFLVVAAPESRLAEVERRHLAEVDRWGPQDRYVQQWARSATEDAGREDGP